MLLRGIYKNRCESADHDDPERVCRIVGTTDVNNTVDFDSVFGSNDDCETI